MRISEAILIETRTCIYISYKIIIYGDLGPVVRN